MRLSSVQGLEERLAGGGTGRNGLLDLSCKERISTRSRPNTTLLTLSLPLELEQFLSSQGLGVRVESEQDGLVSQGVLLLGEGPLLGRLTGRSDDGLDFIRVDDSGNVVGSDLGGGEIVTRLGGVDVVQGVHGTFGPNDESTHVSTGCQLQQVQVLDVAGLDTGDVSESLDQTLVVVVNNQGSSSLPVSPVPHLTLTGSDLSGVGDLDDIGVSLDGLQELDGGLGLVQRFGSVGDDQGNFLDLFDSVTSGEDQGRKGRSSQSRGDGVSSLVLVDLDVPLSPSLGRGEHSTASAHVTESGLAGSTGTTTANTGDTGDGSTGTPGFSRGLVTGVFGDGVGLSSVLGHGLWRRERYQSRVPSVHLSASPSQPLSALLIQFVILPSVSPILLLALDTHCEPAAQHPIGWGR